MDRLIDKKGALPSEEAKLARLVRAAEPVRVSEATRQEVLNEVLRQQEPRRWRQPLWLRPVVIAGMLLAAGVAAAKLGQRWFEQRTAAAPTPDAVRLEAPPQRARGGHIAAPAPIEAPAPEPAEVTDRLTAKLSRPRPAKGEDPADVLAAIKALRTDRDPARASQLLAAYLRAYPEGKLAEEALALSIEAASARHSPSAASFAERYLRQYPEGRFRKVAERALQRPQP